MGLYCYICIPFQPGILRARSVVLWCGRIPICSTLGARLFRLFFLLQRIPTSPHPFLMLVIVRMLLLVRNDCPTSTPTRPNSFLFISFPSSADLQLHSSLLSFYLPPRGSRRGSVFTLPFFVVGSNSEHWVLELPAQELSCLLGFISLSCPYLIARSPQPEELFLSCPVLSYRRSHPTRLSYSIAHTFTGMPSYFLSHIHLSSTPPIHLPTYTTHGTALVSSLLFLYFTLRRCPLNRFCYRRSSFYYAPDFFLVLVYSPHRGIRFFQSPSHHTSPAATSRMVAAASGGIYFIAPCHISLFKFPIHTCLHHYLIHPVMHLPRLVSFHSSILKSQSYYKHTCNTIHRISSPSISCTLPLLSHIVRLCSTSLLPNALSYSLLSKVVHTLFPPFPKFGFPVWTIIRALFSNLYHYSFDTLCSFYYSVVVVEIQQVEIFGHQ